MQSKLAQLGQNEPHPRWLGKKPPRILLTSVFGPYCLDDEYGSRAMNPMELYHNQVTRVQGQFSLRMFHRSNGLLLIQANVGQTPCAVLDFPTIDRFVEELRKGQYDVVGISSIIPNMFKVKKMCELVRQYLPNAKIVVGGHVASVQDLNKRIDADFIVRGEGIRWFRNYLGLNPDAPINHPFVPSAYGLRCFGISPSERRGSIAALVVPAVGCPMGCNFCATSAFFGKKGTSIVFYKTGDALFHILCQLEKRMGVSSFFIMDENFLLDKKRAMRLLELMEEHDKAWAFYTFSSINAIELYDIDELVRLGISWLWIGLEGKDSQYVKLKTKEVNTFKFVRNLQSHGIRVLGSSIIGLESHTPNNVDVAIDYAAEHDTDFHQFMLYTPIEGTPLYAELAAKGLIKSETEIHPGDVHGQARLNYRHRFLNDQQTAAAMIRAFTRDFERNGPSVIRIARTTLLGWRRYKNHPDKRVRRRFEMESKGLATRYAAMTYASMVYYRRKGDFAMYAKMKDLLSKLRAEFGLRCWLASWAVGRFLLYKLYKEEERLAKGLTYEPQTFFEPECPGYAEPLQ